MTYQIIWSRFAETQLDEIFEYYQKEVGLNIAKTLLKAIIETPNKLVESPYIGQKEQLLKQRKIQYRYLVYKNYKLIYSIDESDKFIKIADVFDTRQKPTKIKRGK